MFKARARGPKKRKQNPDLLKPAGSVPSTPDSKLCKEPLRGLSMETANYHKKKGREAFPETTVGQGTHRHVVSATF